MAFEITGHKPGLEGAFVRTQRILRPMRFASPANGRSRA